MKGDVIRIINEEISKFDFLENDKSLKEYEMLDLLSNEEFQKQFICDSLVNRNNKIKISAIESEIGGDWENPPDDANNLTLKNFLQIEYVYDKNKPSINFSLDFLGDNIDIIKSRSGDNGNYNTPSSTTDWFSHVNWIDIDVTINTVDGVEIDFIAFNKAPTTIKNLFIRNYNENLIERESLDVRLSRKNDNANISSYC